MQLTSMEPHIYDLDRDKITDLDKFLKKMHSNGTKLMQLNYSHLKILKLKFTVALSFWSHFLCPCYLKTRFCYLNHSCFFSMQNPQLLLLVSLLKIQKGLLLQNNKIIKWENFVIDLKIFTWNNLIISIVLISWLPIVNLLSFLPVLMHSK